jgi:hypothetical protein
LKGTNIFWRNECTKRFLRRRSRSGRSKKFGFRGRCWNGRLVAGLVGNSTASELEGSSRCTERRLRVSAAHLESTYPKRGVVGRVTFWIRSSGWLKRCGGCLVGTWGYDVALVVNAVW